MIWFQIEPGGIGNNSTKIMTFDNLNQNTPEQKEENEGYYEGK
jgi:hypothetical protein